MNYDLPALMYELTLDEGRRLKPYTDTTGHITIGVGRNLTDVGISDQECDYMLRNDIARAELDLTLNLPWWQELDAVRARVLLNMCFNLGIEGLLQFKSTLADVQAGHWRDAAAGMRCSLWHRQVGARAERLAVAMETGAMPTT